MIPQLPETDGRFILCAIRSGSEESRGGEAGGESQTWILKCMKMRDREIWRQER